MITIRPKPNGPYLVTNCQTLKGMLDGKEHPSDGTVALCCCGGSKNKPFCDGAHRDHPFDDAPTPAD